MDTLNKNGIEKLNLKSISEPDIENTNIFLTINQFFSNYFKEELTGLPGMLKTCKKYVIDRTHTNNRRTGRFIFTEAQHNYLIRNNGYYLFIILDISDIQPNCCQPAAEPAPLINEIFLIRAKDIPYHIPAGGRSIPWTLIKNNI